MIGLYISEIAYLQLNGLQWKVIGVCIGVICIMDFVESEWVEFSDQLLQHALTQLKYEIWGFHSSWGI